MFICLFRKLQFKKSPHKDGKEIRDSSPSKNRDPVRLKYNNNTFLKRDLVSHIPMRQTNGFSDQSVSNLLVVEGTGRVGGAGFQQNKGQNPHSKTPNRNGGSKSGLKRGWLN